MSLGLTVSSLVLTSIWAPFLLWIYQTNFNFPRIRTNIWFSILSAGLQMDKSLVSTSFTWIQTSLCTSPVSRTKSGLTVVWITVSKQSNLELLASAFCLTLQRAFQEYQMRTERIQLFLKLRPIWQSSLSTKPYLISKSINFSSFLLQLLCPPANVHIFFRISFRFVSNRPHHCIFLFSV